MLRGTNERVGVLKGEAWLNHKRINTVLGQCPGQPIPTLQELSGLDGLCIIEE
jgi:hypothetical protein